MRIDPLTDIAVLQYTGGTTGTPKGAMLTHANVYVNVQQVSAWAPDMVDGEERVFGVLPFFHVFALTVVMNFGIAKGAEIVIMPRFSLDEALNLIDRTRPTVMPGVPTLFNAIMNHPKIKSYDLSSLKFCLSGGAPLPVEVKEQFEAITGCKVVEGYGLSETSPVVTCNPLDGPGEGRLDRPAAAGHDHLAARPRRSRQGGAGRREGRDLHQGAAGHARLLQAPEGDRRADGRRLPAHRRRRAHGRGGLLLHRGPHQGPHHLLRASTSIRAASRRRSTSTPASPR